MTQLKVFGIRVCIICLIFTFFSCRENEKLVKLGYDDLYKRFEEKRFLDRETKLYDINGVLISRDTLRKCPPEKYFVDYYVNQKDEVIKAVLRSSTQDDMAFFERVNKSLLNPRYVVKDVVLDCNKKNEYLERALKRDQRIRKDGGNFYRVDHANLDTISSILTKCNPLKWNNVSQTSYDAIFFVLHHNHIEDREAFNDIINYFFDNHFLSLSKKALWVDRMLMEREKPQIYGTQILNGQLYNLADSTRVDSLRKEMGLKPIDEYLKRFGIEWN